VGIPLEILFAIAGATLLHYAIERPFLRLKDRFHPRRARLSAPV
jgi:peptidoglycan/LPS O-acetylase OafA/YrhL